MPTPNVPWDLPYDLALVFLSHLKEKKDRLTLRLVSKSSRDWVDELCLHVPSTVYSSNPLQHIQAHNNFGRPLLVGLHSEPDFHGKVRQSGPSSKDLVFVHSWHEHQHPIDKNKELFRIFGLCRKPVADYRITAKRPWLWSFIGQFKGEWLGDTDWCFANVIVDNQKPCALFYNVLKEEFLPPYQRLYWDCLLEFGDLGEATHVHPVCWAADLVDETCRKHLVTRLLEMDELRNDIQSNNVVHDILDPDLYGNPIPNGSRARRLQMELARIEKLAQENPEDRWLYNYLYILKLESRYHQWESVDFPTPAGAMDVREQYHWVPSDIRIYNGKTVEFLSPIHGLPLPENKQLCRNIARVIQSMLPLFTKLGLFSLGETVDRQVVVKLQMYELPPRSTYTGKWHVEGVTENVHSVGVYYCDVDSALEGGALKFRPPKTAEKFYFHHDPLYEPLELSVMTGLSVAFLNQIPHRFRKITNDTDEPRRRLFMNFFFIDPYRSLASTKTLSNLYGSYSIDSAKEKRQLARKNLSEYWPDGWGYEHYGNAGYAEFISHSNPILQSRSNSLPSTDSDDVEPHVHQQ